MPWCTATITSGTVDMPTTSAPMRAQHPVLGPGLEVRARHRDVHAFPQHDARARARPRGPARAAPGSYGADMSGNRGPSRSSFGPTSGLSPSRLMWSLSSTRSPGAQSGFIPPQAFDTTSVRAPERVQHAHRKGHLLEVVPLVAVEPALHRHDRPAAEPAEQQLARRGSRPWTAESRGSRSYGDLASRPRSRARARRARCRG